VVHLAQVRHSPYSHLHNCPLNKYLFFLASVRRAVHKESNMSVALKRIPKRFIFSLSEREDIIREISLHIALRHPNIVRLHEAMETDEEVILVLDICLGGNLRERLRDYYSLSNRGLVPEEDAKVIAKGVCFSYI
jgi:serine/threonine protein kinase